jgi:hypothetical protein
MRGMANAIRRPFRTPDLQRIRTPQKLITSPMKNRPVSSTVIPAGIFVAAVSVALIGFVSIPWSALPLIVGCYIACGVVFLAFRDYSSAPSYCTPNIHRLTAQDRNGSRASVAATLELRAA